MYFPKSIPSPLPTARPMETDAPTPPPPPPLLHHQTTPPPLQSSRTTPKDDEEWPDLPDTTRLAGPSPPTLQLPKPPPLIAAATSTSYVAASLPDADKLPDQPDTVRKE